MALYRALKEKNIPFVFINGSYPQLSDCVQVVMDDHAGGELAARTLLDRGFTRIGGIFKRDDRQGHERFRGYATACAILEKACRTIRYAGLVRRAAVPFSRKRTRAA